MKKYLYTLPLIFALILILFIIPQEKDLPENYFPNPSQAPSEEESSTSLPNPASQYCLENNGKLEIATNSDGSQLGLCTFADYACEEWVYYQGECNLKADEEKIKQALIAKGLNLSDMKVVINKHLGKYLSGSVVPVSAPAGGGYVFAFKADNGDIQIVADGNGAIMCSQLESYSDFPTYLIPECINDSGNPVTR